MDSTVKEEKKEQKKKRKGKAEDRTVNMARASGQEMQQGLYVRLRENDTWKPQKAKVWEEAKSE